MTSGSITARQPAISAARRNMSGAGFEQLDFVGKDDAGKKIAHELHLFMEPYELFEFLRRELAFQSRRRHLKSHAHRPSH